MGALPCDEEASLFESSGEKPGMGEPSNWYFRRWGSVFIVAVIIAVVYYNNERLVLSTMKRVCMANITSGNVISLLGSTAVGTRAITGGLGLGAMKELDAKPFAVLLHVWERFAIDMPSPKEMEAGGHEGADLHQFVADTCRVLLLVELVCLAMVDKNQNHRGIEALGANLWKLHELHVCQLQVPDLMATQIVMTQQKGSSVPEAIPVMFIGRSIQGSRNVDNLAYGSLVGGSRLHASIQILGSCFAVISGANPGKHTRHKLVS